MSDPDDPSDPDEPSNPDDAEEPDDPFDLADPDEEPFDLAEPHDSADSPGDPADDAFTPASAGAPDDLPTVSCQRCGREWDLGYELDDMQVGNQALEQFALDHKRHTGHFPDGVATWRAACRQCPEATEHLAERAARRWAETHVRHTDHAVDLHHADDETTSRIDSA